MNLKHLLKISGDSTRPMIHGVLFNKTHAKVTNGYVLVEVKHNLELEISTDECVVLDAIQVKQIGAVKGFSVKRDGKFLILNGIPVPIEIRGKTQFIDDAKLESVKPAKMTRPFTISLNPHLLADLQRALTDSPGAKGLELTLDLSQPEMTGAMMVHVGQNEGVFMPMKLDKDRQNQNTKSITQIVRELSLDDKLPSDGRKN